MKKNIITLMAIFIALTAAALKKDPEYRKARREGAEMKMIFHIVDDAGAGVSNALISVFMGMNFDEKGYTIKGETDSTGRFSVCGKTCGDKIIVDITKDGYYRSHKRYCFATMGAEKDVKDGKWQPYGAEEILLLRKKFTLYSAIIDNVPGFKFSSALGEWIGYDISKNSFVKPYGLGETSDFEVYIEWNGKWLPQYSGMGVKIRFIEPYAGYYSVECAKDSDFKPPYKASANKELNRVAEFYEWIQDDGSKKERRFDKSKCWIVRSRCKANEKDELVSAYYSVIYDIDFTCEANGCAGLLIRRSFNPKENDVNLEALER